MTQENSTNESGNSNELYKRLALGGLLVLFIGVIYYQFFYNSGGSGAGAPAVSNNQQGSGTARPATTPRPQARAGATPEPLVSQPLQLQQVSIKSSSGEGTGRNIFVYPPPPPPPTPKPLPPQPTPPPPPITVYSASPSGVIARTGDFNVTIFGKELPEDVKIFIEGREYQTVYVSPTEARAKVPGDVIKSQGNLGVQVRSSGNPALYSNQLSINVAEPPAPPYKFIGLIISRKSTIAVLKSQDNNEETFNVKKGDVVGKHWRITNITTQKIDIEDTNIKVFHVINFTGDGT